MEPDFAKIDASLTTVNQNIEGLMAKMTADEKQNQEIKVELDSLKTTQKTQEAWLRDVEGIAKKRAETGIDGRNSLLEAIPARDRKQIQIANIYGQMGAGNVRRSMHESARKNPIAFAATSLWLQKHLQIQGAVERPEVHAQLRKEKDILERAFGPELVSQAAIGETTANTGTELILTPVEAEVLRLIQDNSMIRQVCRVIPMAAKTHQIPSLDTNVTAYFTAEAGTITDSMAATTFSQKALTAQKIAGLATMSSEILQDSAIALSDFIFGLIAEQIGRLEDTQALEGTTTTAGFVGVNSAVGINSIAAGTNGDAITFANIINSIFTAGEVDSRNGGAFFMHPLLGGKVFGLADSNGGPIFRFADSRVSNQPTTMPTMSMGTLMGFPAFLHAGILTNRAKGTGTNLSNVYFGSWQKLILGDLLGLTFATDPYSLFTSDSVRIRVTKRTGCVVGVPKAFTVIKDKYTT